MTEEREETEELVICDDPRKCSVTSCRHKKPHKKEESCHRCIPFSGNEEDLLLGATNG